MKYLILILLVLNLPVSARTQSVWLEINNATAFEEEFIRKDLQRKFKGIVNLKRDDHFGYDKGVSFDGGIKISFIDRDSCLFSTRKSWSYNLDLEKIQINNIKIDTGCIEQYSETNRYYAFVNTITHEMACHALTNGLDHTDWGLCRPNLSTDKVYWGKKHRRYLRKHLDLPGRTGEVLKI